jgi:hypothetical protein
MYRDDSTLLDEKDRAVGAIQIADGLIVDCVKASKLLASAEHRWRAVREIHDDYAEAWRQLDGARRLLASRGANTIGYDELRGHVVPVLQLREDGVDTKPLEDARRAIEELRLAMPGADWKAIEARTRGLAGYTFVKRGQRWAFAGVAVVFMCAIATWTASTVPKQRVDPRIEARQQMKQELATVVDERKERIESLALMIGGRCDRQNVYEYMKLLVMDGQWRDAFVYGDDYAMRCGEDPEVRKWTRMAKKKYDRLVAR